MDLLVAGETPSEQKLLFTGSLIGSQSFRRRYDINYSYVAGSMYKGISSAKLVARMANKGFLSFIGSGGLSIDKLAEEIRLTRTFLATPAVFGINFISAIDNPDYEHRLVECILKHDISVVEASAFIRPSLALVWFVVSGLSERDGLIVRKHRVIAKISRPEVLQALFQPAATKFLDELVSLGKVTSDQVRLAKSVPLCIDFCVEADSGGHTDKGISTVLYPAFKVLIKRLSASLPYVEKIHLGLGGGLGTPEAIAAAFVMGADFVTTGSINQCTVESGTSELVKDILQQVNVQDTAYAPAGDLFEIGSEIQVLKKGILFPNRAKKLFSLYNQYPSLEALPQKDQYLIEHTIFKQSIGQVWQQTRQYLIDTHQTNLLAVAETNPKRKMALVFKWYFHYTNTLPLQGNEADRENFQIHTGPALGSFNLLVCGTQLEGWRNRHVDDIAKMLMMGAEKILSDRFYELKFKQTDAC